MALSTIELNSNNDLYCPDGKNLSIISGQSALVQDIRLACLLVLGEDIFNTTRGVDYFGTVFTAHKDVDAFRLSLVKAITAFADVISIQSLTITQESGNLNWTARILTVYGSTTVSN